MPTSKVPYFASIEEASVVQDRILVAPMVFVIYDYLLDFDLEAEYIWCQKFTSTSLVYLILRYLGLIVTVSTVRHTL
ncbi:hypothetical protein CONPUDRAFT_83284 [Coniophora puteana RWD-64-598 SS2]|uniref:DUF6533 domain-containing protein n=1 Tax=Coniophora puteana (strain RWD-64-598) TaxID=741705 RepID=A0A5M3MJU3_CONPW|nr:uncharacterized protein CONPUDRAFT_83284 [Coniophora puteana RWD-64-598 SS2]EIW78861.1 hypothetical protein CONPUDRAFT_83284 [Coniophora puteana RWD-64-598 SS2]